MGLVNLLARILIIGFLVLGTEYIFINYIAEPAFPLWDKWFVYYPAIILTGAAFAFMWTSMLILAAPTVRRRVI